VYLNDLMHRYTTVTSNDRIQSIELCSHIVICRAQNGVSK